jgi:hypothetical protein
MRTIATRVEAYQKKRALPPPVASDVADAESSEVSEQAGNAELQVEEETPTGGVPKVVTYPHAASGTEKPGNSKRT